MKKGFGWLKKPQGWLAIALVLILAGSFLSGMFNTSMYSVKVSEIEFETERGTLNGLLYMPSGAGANDPRPVIVTTHGYLNTKEMQDAPAIEMSRRGYIVLALDMYDHGDSRWAAEIGVGKQFGTFWVYSQFDAVKYIYDQPYTLKDENGNAYIAVSGHSMGGFSSFVAMYMDEMNSLQAGYRMIYAGIPAGADLSYAAMVAPADQLIAAFGSRTVGVVAAHYDEFFFGKGDDEKTDAEKAVKGTVVYKDYPATNAGKMFLGLTADDPAGVEQTFYTVESGELKAGDAVVRPSQVGEHIVYTPEQTHPWNHFSGTATKDLINFYQHAFDGVTTASMSNAGLASTNQIWQWKELFNLVALIGFFLLIVPVAMLLMKLPLLKMAITKEVAPITAAKTPWQKLAYWLAIAVGAVIPALLLPALMDKSTASLNTLGIHALVICGLGILVALVGFLAKKDADGAKNRSFAIGGIAVAVISAAIYLLFTNASSIVKLGQFFNEPTVNQIAYWALFSGLLTALIVAGFYYFCKKPQGTLGASYGISLNVLAIVASLCVAVLTVAIGYATLFATQAIFGTDYRIWTLAVRTFKIEHVWTALRYMPVFLVYYFFNAIAINANTRTKKGGCLVAILMNIGGLVLWVAYQYGKLFATGVAAYPTQSLNGILLFALIPCLAVAGVFARKLAQKTNNVWLAAFINTILFTMITAANTAMFWNMVG